MIDFTYSVWVALLFATEEADPEETNPGKWPVVWCISNGWTGKVAKQQDCTRLFVADRSDCQRTNEYFEKIYLPSSRKYSDFLHHENPLRLHERLVVQPGVFLCSANVTRQSQEVLLTMDGSDNPTNLRKYRINPRLRPEVLDLLHRMNVSRASHFPGLDGFTSASKARLRHFLDIYRERHPPPRFVEAECER